MMFTAYHIINLFARIMIALSIYFFACHGLPPCRGRLGEWLNSFGRQSVPVRIKQDPRV